MAINKFMRMALKVLSYPDIDVRKTYQLERSVKSLKTIHPILKNSWEDYIIFSGSRKILVREYSPKTTMCQNTLLFFHGGGWVVENVNTYNKVCHSLADAVGCKVISVEYSLAPEHPFPQGLNDCYMAAREIFLFPERFGIDKEQVVLIGDSAGANLAAAVSLRARDEGEFTIPRQILIYPAVYWDHTPSSPFPSVMENGFDYLLTSKRICEYIDLYKQSDDDLKNPYFAPLMAEDFSNQPDTLIITAEYDPLRDEGEEYGRRLSQAGNHAVVYRMKDALHGYMGLGPRYVHVRRTHELISDFLKKNTPVCCKDK